jgi:hypothetical protein
MDPLNILMNAIEPPWSYSLAGLALLLFISPKLLELRSSWMDLRLGRRNLDLERQRLELLKLRYEIEALRSQHGLPEVDVLPPVLDVARTLAVPSPTASGSAAEVPRDTPEGLVQKSAIGRWLARHPLLGRPTSWLFQIVFGFLTAILGSSTVMLLWMSIDEQEPEFSWWMTLVVAVLYALLTWGSWSTYNRVRRWRRGTWGSAPGE